MDYQKEVLYLPFKTEYDWSVVFNLGVELPCLPGFNIYNLIK